MFREASAIDSERTATSVRSLYAKYSANENWFDGTPDSVDRRIAHAKKIANAAKAACVRLSGRNVVSQYIALAHEMDGDRTALESLRRDLLTAATDREETRLEDLIGPPYEEDERWGDEKEQEEKTKKLMGMRSEARHFIAEQECDDLGELMIRAKHFAERNSSTLTVRQASLFVRSFVEAVRNEYEPPRQQRTAASNYNTQDFPAEFLYFE